MKVIVKEENSSSDRQGRAAVIQDIDAPPYICLKKVHDFHNYPKYVSFLKTLDIYKQEIDPQVLIFTLYFLYLNIFLS